MNKQSPWTPCLIFLVTLPISSFTFLKPTFFFLPLFSLLASAQPQMRRVFSVTRCVALAGFCNVHHRGPTVLPAQVHTCLSGGAYVLPTHTARRTVSTVSPADDRLQVHDSDAGEPHHEGAENDSHLPTTELRDDDEELNEGFDELEAASQEVHDLCYAMIAFLRRADPDTTKDLFERRVKKRIREPVPEPRRRLIHGHGDRGSRRHNQFRSDKDLKEATDLYFQLGEKLLLLLNKPLMDRLLESAGKGFRDLRSDGVNKYRRPLDRASWRTFPHRWFKHAPFEVQQLRADIPRTAVLNTRFYRDHATVRYLFTLMEPQHPYRTPIEKRVFEITQQYDPTVTANAKRPSSPSDSVAEADR